MPSSTFRLAPMSGVIRVMTYALFALPAVFLTIGFGDARAAPATLVGALLLVAYAAVWFLMRPAGFVVSPAGIEIVWPVRRRLVPRSDVVGAEETTTARLRDEFGLLLRVGAGGLWGGFGLAWSPRGRHLAMYVSRHADGFVLVRCATGRSLLITPEDPARFVAEVSRS